MAAAAFRITASRTGPRRPSSTSRTTCSLYRRTRQLTIDPLDYEIARSEPESLRGGDALLGFKLDRRQGLAEGGPRPPRSSRAGARTAPGASSSPRAGSSQRPTSSRSATSSRPLRSSTTSLIGVRVSFHENGAYQNPWHAPSLPASALILVWRARPVHRRVCTVAAVVGEDVLALVAEQWRAGPCGSGWPCRSLQTCRAGLPGGSLRPWRSPMQRRYG